MNHSWFAEKDNSTVYCMFEMRQETDYVDHHIQKLVGFFQSMRNFANELEQKGLNVIYYKINDERNFQKLSQNINSLIKAYDIRQFEYILPDEFRIDQQLNELTDELTIESKTYDNEHFLCDRSYLKRKFGNRKSYVMETFYRSIRKEFSILIEDGKPVGGKWNFDSSNRKSLPPKTEINEFEPIKIKVSQVYNDIIESNISYIGEIDPNRFTWPTNRNDALMFLDRFLENNFIQFGTYQDAMHTEYKYLNHSRISFALNTKMISPLEVVDRAIQCWQSNPKISLSQVEGFVRQIVGWREFMRCIYWAFMPDYKGLNYFNHKNGLPNWYWTGKTKMNCLSHCIKQSLTDAYAHHIQRLMITGNFALLTGINPDEVDQWYLGIYIDALEWVEITNTRGMSQYADGGIVGTKPYVSSASYINKMSNYCKTCHYNYKTKTDDDSCPFNTLYWNFFEVNRDELRDNPRVSMMYRIWDKMDPLDRDNYLIKAQNLIDDLENL